MHTCTIKGYLESRSSEEQHVVELQVACLQYTGLSSNTVVHNPVVARIGPQKS